MDKYNYINNLKKTTDQRKKEYKEPSLETIHENEELNINHNYQHVEQTIWNICK